MVFVQVILCSQNPGVMSETQHLEQRCTVTPDPAAGAIVKLDSEPEAPFFEHDEFRASMQRLWQLWGIALAVAFPHYNFLCDNNAGTSSSILGLREPG